MSKKTITPQLRHVKDIGRHYHLCSLDDIDTVSFQPQPHRKGKALRPEHSFVIADTPSLIVLVHVALATDGLYYTDYQIEYSSGGSSGWPSKSKYNTPPGKTLREALRHELDHLNKYEYHDPDKSVVSKSVRKAAADALHTINIGSLRQMTIFDML